MSQPDPIGDLVLLAQGAADAGEDWRSRLRREWLPRTVATTPHAFLVAALAEWFEDAPPSGADVAGHLESAVLAAIAVLAVGCGGPELRIEVHPEKDVARVYFKPTKDSVGNDYSLKGGEIFIGETPTDWEIPPQYLGGNGYARLEFLSGRSNEVWFPIMKDKDTIVRVAPPATVK